MRPLAPHERYPLIFNTFRCLADGETLEVISSDEPEVVYQRLRDGVAGSFLCEFLDSEPKRQRVRIKKLGGPLDQPAPQ